MPNLFNTFVLLFAFTFQLNNAIAQNYPALWSPRGMGGGGAVYAPSISPFNPNEAYMGCDMSVMSHTLDFGTTWRTISFDTLLGQRHSKVNFTNHPDTLYVEALDQYNSKYYPSISVNGGKTWTIIGPGGKSYWGTLASFRLFANPYDSKQVICSKNDSVLYSNNWGSTFTTIHTAGGQGSSFLHLAGVLFTNDTIFVSTDRGMLISPNNGTSWLPYIPYNTKGIATGAGNEAVISFGGAVKNNITRLFAVTIYTDSFTVKTFPTDVQYFVGLYRMNWNTLQSWNNITSNLTSANAFNKVYQVTMNPDNPDTLYFTGQMRVPPSFISRLGTVFKTTDGGNSFSNVFLQNTNTTNVAMTTGWVGGANFVWEHSWNSINSTEGLCLDPKNVNRLLRSDYSIACTSIDGGTTWQQKYVAFGQHNQGSQIKRTDLYTTNGLQTTVSHWLKWMSPSRVLAAYSDLIMNESNDSGNTWGFLYDSLWSQKVNDISMLEVASSGRIYAPEGETLGNNGDWSDYRLSITTGGKIMYSDNGLNWKLLRDFGKPVSCAAINPNNATVMYVSVLSELTGIGGIYKCTGLPNNPVWSLLPAHSRMQKRPTQIFVLKNNDLLAVYGARDQTTTSPAQFVFTASSGVFLSNNGGASWTDLCATYPSMQKDVRYLTIDPNDTSQNTWLLGVGNSGTGSVAGLYRTVNRGVNWQNVWSGKVVLTSTINPYNNAEMYVCTAQDGLYHATSANTNNPVLTKITSYPFRAPERVFYNPYDVNEVWVASWGNGLSVGKVIPPVLPQVAINIKLYIEGLYLGNGMMQPLINPVISPSLCDTIFMSLVSTSPPYAVVATKNTVLQTNGSGSFLFPNIISGSSYYLVVRHRNSIETWSKQPVTINATNVTFNF